jgi:alkylation response protein AidB-like acyl-CoA dehydrogenase
MRFEYDAEQLALRESLQRFFAQEYSFEKRRSHLSATHGSSPRIWSALAEQGVLAIGLPETHGGIGGAAEVMLVMEEIGRSLVLEPFMSTIALCAPLIAERGSASQQVSILPRIAAGECKLALAHGEPDARYVLDHVRATARQEGSGWLLTGTKQTVLDGAVADRFLVSAQVPGGGISLLLVDAAAAGLEVIRYRTQDDRSAADLVLHDVRVPADAQLGAHGDALPAIERAFDRGIAALCAEAVGAIDAVMQATIEYTKSRKQFGQPIGRFQALQHRMADMFVHAAQARSMSALATERCTRPDAAGRRRDIAAAKAYINKAARFVGQQAVQLHGGMGLADELAVGHYFKRLTLIDATFGDTAHHLATVSAAILADAVPASEFG